ncbi:MAG TPA: hypothetical protein VNS32_04165 [Flavisolibacter sp.]|nr:hypothetical protein [Flavisolibacter sp.]
MSGNSIVSGSYAHELHHLWQSRSMGDRFMANYVMQGLLSIGMNGMHDAAGTPAFVSPLGIYYETIPEYYKLW